MRVGKIRIIDSRGAWHVIDPQKLHYDWHGLGKGTKMLKCLLPQHELTGSLNGPFTLRNIVWKLNSSVLSCSRGQGQGRANGARQMLGHYHEELPSSKNCPTMALTAS